ncbi:MAG: glycosyltransferase [Verrucomicrobiaceae bacterium]|nr:MAG: glycosyltransferase [Verrucomicrobiaceae bacterium]
MSALFSNWPEGSLAQVYIPFMTRIAPSPDVCQKYWPLTPKGIVEDFYRAEDRGLFLSPRQAAVSAAPAEIATLSQARGLTRSRFVIRLADPLREAFYASPTVVTPRLIRWSKEHRPEAIYSMFGSIHCIRIAVKLARTLEVPIVPHFTDDWAATLYEEAFFSGALRRSLHKWLRAALDLAPVRLTIGKGMAEEYERRFGGIFIPAANPADSEKYDPTARIRLPQEPLRLVYMGNLQLQRWQSLKRIGEALALLSADGVSAVLEIYCPQRDREQFASELDLPHVVLKGFVTPDHIPSVLESADVVCLVESFDPAIARYTRLSFSTKIAEYSMAGRPIFALGPKDQTSLQEIDANGSGVHVSLVSTETIAERLRHMLTAPERLHQMGATARAIAVREYSRLAVSARFEDALRTAVTRWNSER